MRSEPEFNFWFRGQIFFVFFRVLTGPGGGGGWGAGAGVRNTE